MFKRSLGVILFCTGACFESAPDAPWAVVVIPYIVMMIGALLLLASAYKEGQL